MTEIGSGGDSSVGGLPRSLTLPIKIGCTSGFCGSITYTFPSTMTQLGVWMRFGGNLFFYPNASRGKWFILRRFRMKLGIKFLSNRTSLLFAAGAAIALGYSSTLWAQGCASGTIKLQFDGCPAHVEPKAPHPQCTRNFNAMSKAAGAPCNADWNATWVTHDSKLMCTQNNPKTPWCCCPSDKSGGGSGPGRFGGGSGNGR